MNKHTKETNSGPRNWRRSHKEGFGGRVSQRSRQKWKGGHYSKKTRVQRYGDGECALYLVGKVVGLDHWGDVKLSKHQNIWRHMDD